MKYKNYVERNKEIFKNAGYLKLVTDTATILDHQLFQDDPNADNYGRKQIARYRKNIFNNFCAICDKCNVSVPPLEPVFYEPYLPTEKQDEKHVKTVSNAKKHISSELRGNRSKSAKLCRTLSTTLSFFPDCCGYTNIDAEDMIAVINFHLIQSGCEPIRPDYTKRKINFSNSFEGPIKKVKVLIVDDSKEEMIKTAYSLAGWPNTSVSYLHYKSLDKKTCAGSGKKNHYRQS